MATRASTLFGSDVSLQTPPKWASGQTIRPDYAILDASAVTTTATRLYYVPMFFPRAESFSGIRTYNQGTGDNGETYRCGIYEESTNGGPGSLLQDCGEVTLTGAAAVRTLAQSFSISTPGWHYLAMHFNSDAAMYRMYLGATAAQIQRAQLFGDYETLQNSNTGTAAKHFAYVDTAYGALASTAVAPTNGDWVCPSIAVYKA